MSFSPALSRKAAEKIVAMVHQWKIQKMIDKGLEDLSRMFDGVIRGWVSFYGRIYKSALYLVFFRLNRRLV